MSAAVKSPSLGDLIRDELSNAGNTPDYDTVAQAVVNRIDPADVPAILLALVRRQINVVAHEDRSAALGGYRTDGAPTGPSRIGQATRAHQRFLSLIVTVDEKSALHKRLGSCTLDDVKAIVANRQARANALEDEAKRFTKLAETMAAQNAHLVSDLSDTVLDALACGWRS
jgi:hypothetical protein